MPPRRDFRPHERATRICAAALEAIEALLDICTVHLQLPSKEKPVPVFAFAEAS